MKGLNIHFIPNNCDLTCFLNGLQAILIVLSAQRVNMTEAVSDLLEINDLPLFPDTSLSNTNKLDEMK